MAGSGVNLANAAELIAATGVHEVHASCSGSSSSSSSSSSEAPPLSAEGVLQKARALGFMGGLDDGRTTDGVKVRELAALVHGL